MKFKIEKEVFLKGIQRTQSVAEKRSTMPILSNIFIEALNDKITIIATDLEIGLKGELMADIEENGCLTISARKMFEVVREMPAGELDIESKENNWLIISSGKVVFKIMGLASEEFPSLPDIEDTIYLSIDSEILKDMIDKTLFSVSTDETRYNINGVLLERSKEEHRDLLRMISTDGHRLSIRDREIDMGEFEMPDRNIIIPRKGLQELRRIIDEGNEKISMGFKGNNGIFKTDSVVLVARLIDGEFPDYDQVLPKENDKDLILDREIFLISLRRMSILSTDRSKGVKLTVSAGSMHFSSNNPDLGEAEEEFEIDYSGEGMSIGFNARYLVDVLNIIEDEKVMLTLKDELNSGILTLIDDKDYRYVIMPMRI